MKKPNTSDRFLSEVVNYGGLLMRRAEVYALALMQGWSRKDADSFAFGYCVAVDAEPAFTAAEAFAFMQEAA